MEQQNDNDHIKRSEKEQLIFRLQVTAHRCGTFRRKIYKAMDLRLKDITPPTEWLSQSAYLNLLPFSLPNKDTTKTPKDCLPRYQPSILLEVTVGDKNQPLVDGGHMLRIRLYIPSTGPCVPTIRVVSIRLVLHQMVLNGASAIKQDRRIRNFLISNDCTESPLSLHKEDGGSLGFISDLVHGFRIPKRTMDIPPDRCVDHTLEVRIELMRGGVEERLVSFYSILVSSDGY